MARFPDEAIAALRAEGLLGVACVSGIGHSSWSIEELARATTTLSAACASTGLIWAMHHSQVLTIARHAPSTSAWDALRTELAQGSVLVASAASEPGSGADFLSPTARLEPSGRDGVLELKKHASTASYGQQADAYLATALRSADDVAFAFVRRADAEVEVCGTWDPMGMRGTAGPPMRIEATVDTELVLPDPAEVVLARTMIPVAHILWGACWIGIAQGALDRGREAASTGRGFSPLAQQSLVDSAAALAEAERLVAHAICEYEAQPPSGGLSSTRYYNTLKIRVSSLTTSAVLGVLRAAGMRAYMEDGEYSVAQSVRDILSAELMVNNFRLREVEAQLDLLDARRLGRAAT